MRTTRLDGRTIAVTGATSGIGYFIAEALALAGADVVVAGRSEGRARHALAHLPGSGRHRFLPLDLADPSSTRDAGRTLGEMERLDGLVLNAGRIAASAKYRNGPFDVESTVAVNFLAHVELVRLALPSLERSPGARIVSTGSSLTRRIPFDRENWLAHQDYRPRVAYAMSKHATEIFGFELARRLRAQGLQTRSVVSHPGGAIDALTPDRPGIHERSRLMRGAARLLAPAVAPLVQGKDGAAQPAVLALTAVELPDRAYLGPRRGASGDPMLVQPVASSLDQELGSWLWQETERILGAHILAEPPAAPT